MENKITETLELARQKYKSAVEMVNWALDARSHERARDWLQHCKEWGDVLDCLDALNKEANNE